MGDVGSDVGPSAARTSHDPAVRRVANGASVGDGASVEDQKRAPEDAHGRTATHPKEIPKAGWRDIGMRVWQNLGRDNTSLVAAGIGLNALLAVFPALAVLVSVYGMFAYPGDVARDLGPFLSILPGDASKLTHGPTSDSDHAEESYARLRCGRRHHRRAVEFAPGYVGAHDGYQHRV